MGDTLSELGVLNQKIDFFLNTFYKIKDENDELRDKLLSIDKEILIRDNKIDSLTQKLQNKELELQEVVAKLEKILD